MLDDEIFPARGIDDLVNLHTLSTHLQCFVAHPRELSWRAWRSAFRARDLLRWICRHRPVRRVVRRSPYIWLWLSIVSNFVRDLKHSSVLNNSMNWARIIVKHILITPENNLTYDTQTKHAFYRYCLMNSYFWVENIRSKSHLQHSPLNQASSPTHCRQRRQWGIQGDSVYKKYPFFSLRSPILPAFAWIIISLSPSKMSWKVSIMGIEFTMILRGLSASPPY